MDYKPGTREHCETVRAILVPLWPNAVPLLSYRNPWELLVAVVLSAQCTDEQVNKVTPGLFSRWPDASALASAPLSELEEAIRSTGFYRNKAKHLKASAILVARNGDRVPEDFAKLLELPGVGRKTANLVASACFGYPGIIVDTHVLRAAKRLGIAVTDDADESERRIADLVEPAYRTAFSHAMNRHGKHVCQARKPLCHGCPVAALCPRTGLETEREL